MHRLGLVNAYGPAGLILTMPLASFLAGHTPAIKAADDSPPDGKPALPITPPTPYSRAGMIAVDRWTAPDYGSVVAVGPRRPGKF